MNVNIVGGGVAGTVLALHLLQRGITPRIFEPRPGTTLCAEGLSQRTLDALTVFDAKPYIAQHFVGARWQFPGTRLTIPAPCMTMNRQAWIPAMLDTAVDAGATHEKRRVTAAELDGYVIGCDGPGSGVAQTMGATVQRRTGMQMHVKSDNVSDHLEFVTRQDFGDEYGWWFPRGEFHNVGLLAQMDGRDHDRLRALCDYFELPIGKVEAFPIAFGGRLFSQKNMALLGDAAGLTNPLTKGGMAAIIHAAPLLADAIAHGNLNRYQLQLQRHPLTHRSFLRTLRLMHKLDDAKWQRLLRYAPQEINVGHTSISPIAKRMLLHAPWRAGNALSCYGAAKHAIGYSW